MVIYRKIYIKRNINIFLILQINENVNGTIDNIKKMP